MFFAQSNVMGATMEDNMLTTRGWRTGHVCVFLNKWSSDRAVYSDCKLERFVV